MSEQQEVNLPMNPPIDQAASDTGSMALRDLVQVVPVSTRVYNCVFRAPKLPFETIADYLAAGEEAMPTMMLKLKNFGRRSAEEVDELVRRIAGGALLVTMPTMPEADDAVAGETIADDQVAAFLSLPLEEAAALLGAPVALYEVLAGLREQGRFVPYHSVLELYADGEEAARKLSVVVPEVAGELYGFFRRVQPNTPFFMALMHEIRSEGSVFGRASRRVAPPIELMTHLVATLNPNLQAVLRFRYGYDGEIDHTLHEVGEKMGLTRERVRQLEEKALRRLRPYTDLIHESLVAAKDEIWSYVNAPYGAVSKRTFPLKHFIENVLPGELELAFDLIFDGDIGRFFGFLDCRETSTGWYRTAYSEIVLADAEELVATYLRDARLPQSVQLISHELGIAPDLAGLSAANQQDIVVWEGYLVKEPPGRKIRRLLRLHRLAGHLGRYRPIPLPELVAAHNGAFPAEACSERDAYAGMSAAPHLFLSLADYGWKALGQPPPWQDSTNVEDAVQSSASTPESLGQEEALSDEEPEGDEYTEGGRAVELLRDILRSGPRNLGDIGEAFVARSEGRFSKASVAPVMLMAPDIVRVAPGIYALLDQVKVFDPIRGEAPSLLEPAACRHYVMARHAEEQRGSFPFWTIGMERAWCRWAEAKERAEQTLEMRLLYESLLAIAIPEDWNTSDQAYWSHQKTLRGRYMLASEPSPLQDYMPGPLEILRALAYIQDHEAVNWMAANRLIQRRVEFFGGGSVLALLVGLGVLRPTLHWQLRHERAEDDGGWCGKLAEAQASSNQPLSWSDAVPQAMLQAILRRLDEFEPGWVPTSELRDLVERYLAADDFEAEEQAEVAPADDVASLLTALRENRKVERLNRLLAQVSEGNEAP